MKFSRLYDIDRETAIDINLSQILEVVPLSTAYQPPKPALVTLVMAVLDNGRPVTHTIWVDTDDNRTSDQVLDLFWELAHANLVEANAHF